MKRTSAAAMVAIILWGVTALAPISHAQEAPPQQPARGLDLNSLNAVLTNLGYETKKVDDTLQIKIERDSWTYYLEFEISSDSTRLGINSNLGKIDNPDGITASQWQTLLVKNKDVDPCCFHYDQGAKELRFHLAVDNRDLTAADLRTDIDFFVSDIYKTHDAWNFTK